MSQFMPMPYLAWQAKKNLVDSYVDRRRFRKARVAIASFQPFSIAFPDLPAGPRLDQLPSGPHERRVKLRRREHQVSHLKMCDQALRIARCLVNTALSEGLRLHRNEGRWGLKITACHAAAAESRKNSRSSTAFQTIGRNIRAARHRVATAGSTARASNTADSRIALRFCLGPTPLPVS